MADLQIFQPGDEVLHPKRLEWGTRVVDQARQITHQGQQAQRLVVTFAHRGRVAINTAVASLQSRKNKASTMSNAATTAGRGWLEALADKQGEHELHRLPDAMVDPFASLTERLKATLDNFRFNAGPRPLIDWAIAQTGLDDPLTLYTRQELEQEFQRFAYIRGKNLLELAQTIKSQGKRQVLDEALEQTPYPEAKAALQKAVRA
jgi:hypothetical protein